MNVTKHYSFNGVAMAVCTGSANPSLLYQDGVHSTAYVTDLNGNMVSQRGYYAFGPLRRSTGTMPTDRRFTGQQEDATGIYYFNSRYYDAQISQFISPDTIVPDEKNFLSYNRYLYALGNPLKYNDPSGHQAACAAGDAFCWENRWYNARGYSWNGADWSTLINPVFADEGVIDEMMGEAGIAFVNDTDNWNFDRKGRVATGVALLAQKLQRGFTRLSELLGGNVNMYLQAGDPAVCQGSSACALPPGRDPATGDFSIQWSAAFIDQQHPIYVGGTAVHELAHVMDWRSREVGGAANPSFSVRWRPFAPITSYAACQLGNCMPGWEKWAEAVTYSVYAADYVNNSAQRITMATNAPNAAALNVQMAHIANLLNGVR